MNISVTTQNTPKTIPVSTSDFNRAKYAMTNSSDIDGWTNFTYVQISLAAESIMRAHKTNTPLDIEKHARLTQIIDAVMIAKQHKFKALYQNNIKSM